MRLEAESAGVREAFPAEYADLVLPVTELGGTAVPRFQPSPLPARPRPRCSVSAARSVAFS